jgi:hypothetical protein
LTRSVFNALISKSLINFSYLVDIDIAFFKKKISNTKKKHIKKNIKYLDKETKLQRKKMRDQSDFRFSDHQVCLKTKQLKENKKFYFVYK